MTKRELRTLRSYAMNATNKASLLAMYAKQFKADARVRQFAQEAADILHTAERLISAMEATQ